MRSAAASEVLRQEAQGVPITSPGWVSYALGAFGLAILAIFAATTNFRQLGGTLHQVRTVLLGVAVACTTAQVLVKALRWRFMVNRLTGARVSIRFATISIVAGVAAGSLAPSRSFEVAKAMLLKGSYGVSLGLSASAMIAERMLDLAMLVGALLLAALLLPRHMVLASGALLVTIAVLIGISVLVVAAPLRIRRWGEVVLRVLPSPPRFREQATRLLETFMAGILLWRQSRILGALLFWTAVSTGLDLARVCAVFWAMGATLSVPFLAFTYIGAALLGMALLIPGGVGVTEVSQVGLIGLLAPGVVPSTVARSAVLLDRFLSYYLLTLIGAGLLIAYHRYRRVFR